MKTIYKVKKTRLFKPEFIGNVIQEFYRGMIKYKINFRCPFEDVCKDKVVDRMERDGDRFNCLMEEWDFSTLVFNSIMKEVYRRFNADLHFTPYWTLPRRIKKSSSF
jgi:hypothetical protein